MRSYKTKSLNFLAYKQEEYFLSFTLLLSHIHVGVSRKRTLHQCTHCMHAQEEPVLYLLGHYSTVSLLSPDAVICYFINVFLTIIVPKAAKLHIMNCNKLRTWGCIHCFMVALLQLAHLITSPSNRYWYKEPLSYLYSQYNIILTKWHELVLNCAWLCTELHIVLISEQWNHKQHPEESSIHTC